jgi:hypothetical protein
VTDYPDEMRERAILTVKAPEVPERLAGQVVAFLQKPRSEDLVGLPGVAETIDWAQARPISQDRADVRRCR